MTNSKIWRMHQFNKCFAHLQCLGKALARTCWENSCSFLCFLRLVSCNFLCFQRKHYFQLLFFLSLSALFLSPWGKFLAKPWQELVGKTHLNIGREQTSSRIKLLLVISCTFFPPDFFCFLCPFGSSLLLCSTLWAF